MKCDYKTCSEEATTKGFVYGHEQGSGEKDDFILVNACDKHKRWKGFIEHTCDHDLGGICGKCVM